MNYKYAPIYKYALFFLIIYMFLKHQYILTPMKILSNAITITLIIMVLDYIIIRNHPSLLENYSDSDHHRSHDKKHKKKSRHDKKSFDEELEKFTDVMDDDEIDDIIESIDSKSDDLNWMTSDDF